MSRKTIVIASVLKTVTDTRMYEKFALSISQTKQYEVKIIGFYIKNLPNENNIKFYPYQPFNRLSLKRILIPFVFLIKLIKLKPDKIIITTHELLFLAGAYRCISGCKLYYDVQENYYNNILYTFAFPKILRFPIAVYVRTKEWLTRPLINHYILAEQCYANELGFVKNKYTVIENKAAPKPKIQAPKPLTSNGNINIVFTGTIAKTTGIFECIKLIKNLHQLGANIRLTIIGYCSQKKELECVKKQIENYQYITCIGGDNYVPHEAIIEHIQMADFGFVYYPPNPANDYCIPTKIYEYLSVQLPMLISAKAKFTHLTDAYKAAIKIDFESNNYQPILDEMVNGKFYVKPPKSEVLWSSESLKLFKLLAL